MASPLKSQNNSGFIGNGFESLGTNLTPKRYDRLVQPTESVYSISKR